MWLKLHWYTNTILRYGASTLKALDTELAKIANILFLSNKNITFDVKSNSPMSLYGNIIGSGGAVVLGLLQVNLLVTEQSILRAIYPLQGKV